MRVENIFKYFLLLSLHVIVQSHFLLIAPAGVGNTGQNDFLNYVNYQNYAHKNVLILGVDAQHDRAFDLLQRYHFDLVIPISREGGLPKEDWGRALIEKLGISTGGLEQLRGKMVENLYIHSWGSSRTFNQILMDDVHAKNIHALGSPHSALMMNSLGQAFDTGRINKVYFHINQGDLITEFRHFPSGLEGRFTSRIEFHFYTTARNQADTIYKSARNITVFNAPIGFDKYIHYNSPATSHGLENYFMNMSFALIRDKRHSPFRNNVPVFHQVPAYWTNSNCLNSGTESQIMTDMVCNQGRVLIVGSGEKARLMYNNMANDVGAENVKWQKSVTSDRQLQLYARKFGADVILGVKGYAGKPGQPIPNTPVFVNRHTAELCLETASTLEDAMNYLDKSTESHLINNISRLHDFTVALQKDIEMSMPGGPILWRSYTLEQVGKFGLGQMPEVVSALKASGSLPSTFQLPATFGAEEFAVAMGRHIGSGTADIETTTAYLDGINKACWATVGFLVAGPEGASVYQSVAGTGATLLREATMPLFYKAVLAWGGQGKDLVNQWQTLQERRMHDGLPVQTLSEVYGENLLLKNGLNRKMVSRLDAKAHNINQSLINMKRDFGVDSIETFQRSGKLELGGVYIDPDPEYAGEVENGLADNVLVNRPSNDSSSWNVLLPEGIE